MVKLRGQLLVHRDRLGQSSLLAALRQGSHAAFDVVQLRPSLFRLAAAALYRLDGGEQAFVPAGRVLRGGLHQAFAEYQSLYTAEAFAITTPTPAESNKRRISPGPAVANACF